MNNYQLILSNKPLQLGDYTAGREPTGQAEKLQQLLLQNVPNMAYYHFDSSISNTKNQATKLAQSATHKNYIIDITSIKNLKEIWEEVKSNANNLAAIIVNPLAVFTGSKPALGEYLRELRRITFLNQAIFIIDETYTGFRLGLGGAQVEFDVDADMVILGGVLTGGYRLSILGVGEANMPSELFTLAGDVEIEALMAGEYVITQLLENRGIYQELERRARDLKGQLEKQLDNQEHAVTQLASILKYPSSTNGHNLIFLNLDAKQLADYV